jgi:hypothetical protein
MVSNEVADVAISTGHLPEQRQRTMVVLLDAGWALCDFERYVGHLVHDQDRAMPVLIVSQLPTRLFRFPTTWSIVQVPDVVRVAAAFGVFTLPAVVVSGEMDETRQRIETIVRWQARIDAGRASGALSADELHN